MPDVLFIHQTFPGQYKHVAAALGRDPEWNVTFLTEARRHQQQGPAIEGVRKMLIASAVPKSDQSQLHPFLKDYDSLIRRGEMYYAACRKLVERDGLRPDVVAVHHGAGVEQFVRDAFPDTPILTYHEYFPRPEKDFQQDFPPRVRSDGERMTYRVFAGHIVNQLVWSDWSTTPTYWQRSLFPDMFHSRMSVIHDGIDTQTVDPARVAIGPVKLPDGAVIVPGDEVVTCVSHYMDNVRGFPTVMRAIKAIQKRRPDCQFVVVGKDAIGYGKPPPGGGSWRQAMLAELDLNLATIHFPGEIDYATYLQLLRVSSAHIYLTTGFVLSWSVLEAMAMECLVIGSATPPVQEVIVDGENGLLAGFHDHERVAEQVLRALQDKEAMQTIRRNARQTIVQRYALSDLLPLQLDLLKDLAARRIPPPTAARIEERSAKIDRPVP